MDDGTYAAALAAGRPQERAMFTRLTPTGVRWPDGTEEPVDVVLLATGYRPDLGYLPGTGALHDSGRPLHCRGMSTSVPSLGYVGLPGQTGFASAPVRGVARDADGSSAGCAGTWTPRSPAGRVPVPAPAQT